MTHRELEALLAKRRRLRELSDAELREAERLPTPSAAAKRAAERRILGVAVLLTDEIQNPWTPGKPDWDRLAHEIRRAEEACRLLADDQRVERLIEKVERLLDNREETE